MRYKERTGSLRLPVLSFPYNPYIRLFLLVSLVEFVHATCRIHEFHLSRIERMRCIRNLDFDYRILDTFNSDGLLGTCP